MSIISIEKYNMASVATAAVKCKQSIVLAVHLHEHMNVQIPAHPVSLSHKPLPDSDFLYNKIFQFSSFSPLLTETNFSVSI